MDLTPPQNPGDSSTQTPPSPSAQDLPTSPLETPDPNSRHPHRIFFGPFGLRALWSLLIYFALLGVIGGTVFAIGHEVYQHHERAAAAAAAKAGKPAPPPSKSIFTPPDGSKPIPMVTMITGELAMFALFFFASWLMALIERRKLSAFGLGGAHPLRRLVMGAFWGIASISLLILALHSLHFLVFDSRLDHGRSILFWGAVQLFAFLLVGLTEEYTMRGYLQFTLTRGLVCIGNLISRQHARAIAFWIAAILTSALFLSAHIHNAGENWLGLFQVFLAGLLFVVALWRTGSLWWGIGFHMAWDWGQSFLYGVRDSGMLDQGRLFATHPTGNSLFSGGTVGPEGSVFVIPIILLAMVVLFFTHPSPQPPLELAEPPLSLSTQDFPIPDSPSPVA